MRLTKSNRKKLTYDYRKATRQSSGSMTDGQFEIYKLAIRRALGSGTDLQRKIANAILDASNEFRIRRRDLAARLNLAPGTVNREFGRLGHRVWDILQWHPDGLEPPNFDWSHMLLHFEPHDDGWERRARDEFFRACNMIFQEEVEGEEVSPGIYLEGGANRRSYLIFDRSRKAREECIRHFGPVCVVCGFDFSKHYGQQFAGTIHVHHLVEISTRYGQYQINPIRDLRPVCPNCHTTLHAKDPAYTIEEMLIFVQSMRGTTSTGELHNLA